MARARNSDPATSHDAAKRVEESGVATGQRGMCLRAVQNHPEGLTSKEVAKKAGLDRYQAARRLPELREAGLVVNDGERDGEQLWKPVFQPSWKKPKDQPKPDTNQPLPRQQELF